MNGLPSGTGRTPVRHSAQARRPHSLGRRVPCAHHQTGARSSIAPGPAGQRQGATRMRFGAAWPVDGPRETALGLRPRTVTRRSQRRKHLRGSGSASPTLTWEDLTPDEIRAMKASIERERTMTAPWAGAAAESTGSPSVRGSAAEPRPERSGGWRASASSRWPRLVPVWRLDCYGSSDIGGEECARTTRPNSV
jgi:hypothetical protein